MIQDQPPPNPNDGPAIWDLVIADMIRRDKIGEARYGTRLQAGNGRDPLRDAYQEALDLVVYLRQAIEERKQLSQPIQCGNVSPLSRFGRADCMVDAEKLPE